MTTYDESIDIPAVRIGLRPAEAAEVLGVSKSKFDELLADRTSGLPVFKIGKRNVIHARLLDEWAANRVKERA